MTEELVDVFDEYGVRTQETLSKDEAIERGKLIKAFQIWILNNKNEVLMQTRSGGKTQDAGMLDLCSGHVKSGETERQAVVREIIEELGPEAIKPKEFYQIEKVGSTRMDLRKYGRQGNYIVPWYYLKLNRQIPEENLELQEDEVQSVQWIPYEQVKEIIRDNTGNIRIPYLKETARLFGQLDVFVYEKHKDNKEVGER